MTTLETIKQAGRMALGWLDRVVGRCRHRWQWERNIYGDEIIWTRYRRSWLYCLDCGKRQLRKELVDKPEVICTCGISRPKWRPCPSCGRPDEYTCSSNSSNSTNSNG
jgi:hypothetical protein